MVRVIYEEGIRNAGILELRWKARDTGSLDKGRRRVKGRTLSGIRIERNRQL
tara:strand:- start:82 stop:237 length:156 start_codon:yes stop_codon:yes gene_type:complete